MPERGVIARCRGGQESTRRFQLGRDVEESHETEVPDLDEVAGQDVQEESADEFGRRHSGGIAAASPKDHGLVVHADQPSVADGHAMCVLARGKEPKTCAVRTDVAPGPITGGLLRRHARSMGEPGGHTTWASNQPGLAVSTRSVTASGRPPQRVRTATIES